MPSLIRPLQEARHALRGQLALVVPPSPDRDHQQTTIPIAPLHPQCQYDQAGHSYGANAWQPFSRWPQCDAGWWASSGVRNWSGLTGQQGQSSWDHDFWGNGQFEAFEEHGAAWVDPQLQQQQLQMQEQLQMQAPAPSQKREKQMQQKQERRPAKVQEASRSVLAGAMPALAVPASVLSAEITSAGQSCAELTFVPDIAELSTEQADAMVAWLTEGTSKERTFAMDQIVSLFWPLAASQQGSRVVQKVLEIADGAEQTALIAQLQSRVCEASKSPHANYVLQRCIEVLPTERLQFIFDELKGRAVVTARHRCGCRILQRLVERCAHEQTAELVTEVMTDADRLCRHPFGNFVLQHILDHGTEPQRSAVVCALLPDARGLARHRIASHVLQRALVRSSNSDRERLTLALTASAEERRSLVHSQYGSFVMREVASKR